MGKNLADVEYKMRMTQDLKDKIVESAKEHNRSMNADIVARLEESFTKSFTESVDFAKGFLNSYLQIRATTYYSSMIDLKEQYEKEPSTELLYEITKYEILFNEMMKLAQREEELRLQKFDNSYSADEFEKITKQAFAQFHQIKKSDES
ncbi:Arc family DNA-binding protein [Acinetobacter sp. ANC 5600]|uniref:Arc family DNA-binding protein n=1 Tax=Acinetobacter sp. ANC 5600 TaxID=1960940 RepID=UPI001D171665|nr:Arc family DNA-binding protein [Acinetobacter sp. ANC 5600]